MQASLLRWVALAGLVLVLAVVGWTLTRGSYKGDLQKVCNAEDNAGVAVTKDQSAVNKWVKEHLDTPEANVFFDGLTKRPLVDRAKALDDEAKKLGIARCPLVASYAALSVEGQFKSDLRLMCTLTGLAGIETMDDDKRVAKLKEWRDTKAKSEKVKEVVDKVVAADAKTRGEVMQAIANDNSVYQCELAHVLSSPPTVPAVEEGFIRLRRAEVSGDLSEIQVMDALKSDVDALRKCYEAGLAKNKALAGPISFRVVLEPSGKVTQARAMSGPKDDKQIAECMAKAIEGVAFPPTKSAVTKIMLHLDLVPNPDLLPLTDGGAPDAQPGAAGDGGP